MNINSIVKKDVISMPQYQTISEVAKLMKRKEVGSIVITDTENNRIPVGIITDRDIAIRVVAEGEDPNTVLAEDIMSVNLFKIEDSLSTEDAINLMSKRGVRRAPVVNKDNRLVGIISLDKILETTSTFLGKICSIVHKQSRA